MRPAVSGAAGFLAALLLGVLSFGAATVPDGFRRPVYIVNHSSYPGTRLIGALPALQAAVDKDYAPAWGTDAELIFLGNHPAPEGAWTITLENSPDIFCFCYGYHDQSNGTPYAKVFTDAGSVTITLSHELWEMLSDPLVNTAANVGSSWYLLEAADPVEGNQWAYRRQGRNGSVTISDFPLPAWFVLGSSGPWDFTRHTTRPLQVLGDGYQSVWSDGGWTTIEPRT